MYLVVSSVYHVEFARVPLIYCQDYTVFCCIYMFACVDILILSCSLRLKLLCCFGALVLSQVLPISSCSMLLI